MKESNEDQEISDQKERIASNEEDEEENAEKLNINKKKEEDASSSRGELIKEDKTKTGKDDEEINVLKKKSTTKSQKNIETPQENQKEEEKKESKEDKEGKEEETKKEEKNEGEEGKIKETVSKKIKFPITPYKVSDLYQSELMSTLKKENKIRPTCLLAPEKDDITKKVLDLDKEENDQILLEREEDLNAEDKERLDKIYLNKYKESTLLGKTMIEDPMALFYGAEKAFIDQFYKLSDLFVICPLYFNYRISLQYANSEEKNVAYHLFNTKEISPPCSHNCCPNQAREIDINIFNYILNSTSTDRKIQKFIKLKKNCRCALSCFCACCSRPTFIVETPIEMLGKITELRTTSDPIIHITDINNDVVYEIKTDCSNCGYCCRDQCCDNPKCSSCVFFIYDGTENVTRGGKKTVIGTIEKFHRSGKKTKPDYDQLVVVFPVNSSCQNKILIICAALVIEYLYFQNMSNTKRCSGKPRFLNAYSD